MGAFFFLFSVTVSKETASNFVAQLLADGAHFQ